MKRIEYILLCSLMVLLAACEKDTLPMNFSPVLKTGEATEIYRMGATLSGSIQKSEGVVVKDCGILLSELQSMAEYTELKITTSDVTSLSVQVKDLQPGKTYYYCAYASSGYSIARGEIKTFTTTESNAPVFGELQVSERDEKSLTVSTVLLDEGGSELILSGFCWKEADEGKGNPTTRDNVVNATPEGGKITARMKDLKADKEYAVCAYGVNAKGVGYGKTIVVKTQNATVPALSSITPVDSTALSIMVKASILSSGETEISEYGFCWSAESQTPTTAHMKQVVTEKDNNNAFSLNIADLRPETTYYIRAYAINGQGNGYGDILKYTTRKGLAVTTLHAEVTGTTVVVYGVVTPGTENNHHGFEFATNRDDLLNQTGDVRSVDVHTNLSYNQIDGTFHGELGALEANTTYYVRAWFMDAETSQWVYGDIMEVRTGAKGIYTLEDLIAFRDAKKTSVDMSKWTDSENVVNIYADIDLSSVDNWEPIKHIGAIVSSDNRESLNGHGHTISGLKMRYSPSEAHYGFIESNQGAIRNLHLKGSVIIDDYDTEISCCAALCGINHGVIEDCSVEVDIDAGEVKSNVYVGGICGFNALNGVIKRCVNRGTVAGTQGAHCHGIAGNNYAGLIEDCDNYGAVISNSWAAGIAISFQPESKVVNCTNYGEIIGSSTVGGIVSHLGGTIDNCKNHGKVSGESSVGGIAGAVLENAILKNSQNIGDIMGTDASSTGGVCGWLDGSGTYENNTNGGTVNGVAGTEANAIGYDGRKGGIIDPE